MAFAMRAAAMAAARKNRDDGGSALFEDEESYADKSPEDKRIYLRNKIKDAVKKEDYRSASRFKKMFVRTRTVMFAVGVWLPHSIFICM